MSEQYEGREQGAALGSEAVYTHPDHDREEHAYTAADRVNLEARGWVRKPTGSRASSSSRKTPATGQGGSGDAPAASS